MAFLLIVSMLLVLDYQNETSGAKSFFLTSILQDLIKPSTITDELLSNTSLNGKKITDEEDSPLFFEQYLQLPDNINARRYSIEGTTLTITEIRSQNPLKMVPSLLAQESPDYTFNKINAGTFYLNQVPVEKKTHNFLGIVINDTLYGFQYLPQEHQKVLEIIDALQQNK